MKELLFKKIIMILKRPFPAETSTILRIALFFISISISSVVHGQSPVLNINDLSKVKVNELSDEQVKQFISRAKESGMTMEQLESAAISRVCLILRSLIFKKE